MLILHKWKHGRNSYLRKRTILGGDTEIGQHSVIRFIAYNVIAGSDSTLIRRTSVTEQALRRSYRRFDAITGSLAVFYLGGGEFASAVSFFWENHKMLRNLFTALLICSQFATNTLAQHNDRKFRFTIDLAHEELGIVESGQREIKITFWPVTFIETNIDKLCVCNKPDCYEVDSSITLAHYPTNKFNNALFGVFQQLAGNVPLSGSQLIAQLFDFPVTSWSFSPADSSFEIKSADETLTDFDNGDVVFLSHTTSLERLTNFKDTYFAIFLGRHAPDGRSILLTQLGGEMYAIDMTSFADIYPNAKHIFRLRSKNPLTQMIQSSSFDCL